MVYYAFGKQIKLYQVEEPGERLDHDLSICEQRVLWCQCGESLVDASLQHPALPPAHLCLRYVRQAAASNFPDTIADRFRNQMRAMQKAKSTIRH